MNLVNFSAYSFLVLCDVFCFTETITNNEVDLGDHPLIVWWHDGLFPHFGTDQKDVHKLTCNNGAVCQSSKNSNLVEMNVLQTIIMYGSDFRPYEVPLPRKENQMWALLHEESPQNNYILSQPNTLKLFNITATTHSNSDFSLTTQYIPNVDYFFQRKYLSVQEKNRLRKKGLAPVVYVQSNCNVPSDRSRYVRELMKHIQIDSYGKCLHNKDFSSDDLEDMSAFNDEKMLDLLAKYKFHLAFENAICDDYVTEKLYRALHVGSVPVYRGSPNVKKWSPTSRSLIMVDDFQSPKRLAQFLKMLDENDASYERYLDYKNEPSSFNQDLKVILEKRKWSPSSTDDVPHFIPAFECFVCEQMNKMINKEAKHEGEGFEVQTGEFDHFQCPKPTPSIGKVQDLEKNDSFHEWLEDYDQSLYQSQALLDMIIKNESNPLTFWNYVENLMLNDLHKHNEL